MELKIKKVNKTVYEFSFSKMPAIITPGYEFYVSENGVSEFVQTFKKQDLDAGVVVTPYGYSRGLFYSAANDGEIYSSVKFEPDVINFAFNIFGLKKGAYYRVRVPGRSSGGSTIITDDRKLLVLTEDQEVVIDEDFTDVYDKNIEAQGIFRAHSNEINLLITMGKIYMSDFIIEEVELFSDEVKEEETTTLECGKFQTAAFGVFNMKMNIPEEFKGRYVPVSKVTGAGVNLYYDRSDNSYLLERDPSDDILGESFTLINYKIDLNDVKVVNAHCDATKISAEPGPNTLKPGYVAFDMVDRKGEKVDISKTDGNRLYVYITKIF